MIGAIHTYLLVSEGTRTVESDGRVTRTGQVSTPIVGRVDDVAAIEVKDAAQVGQTFDIVCDADLDVVVNDRMTVLVSDPPQLAGEYRIDAIRTTRTKLRIFASRNTIQDVP